MKTHIQRDRRGLRCGISAGRNFLVFFFGLGFGFLTRNCGGFDKVEFELAGVRLESGSWD